MWRRGDTAIETQGPEKKATKKWDEKRMSVVVASGVFAEIVCLTLFLCTPRIHYLVAPYSLAGRPVFILHSHGNRNDR